MKHPRIIIGSLLAPFAFGRAETTTALTGSVNLMTSCSDNRAFFHISPSHDCDWIKGAKARREQHCQLREVRENCPFVCGVCCMDDAAFRFPMSDNEQHPEEGLKSCAWLADASAYIAKSYCLDEVGVDARRISRACPKTCGACQDLIPFEEVASVEWMGKTASLQSRKLQVTTSSPSACLDDDNYRSPIAPSLGCELHRAPNCDCHTFQHLMTMEQIQELFSSCPQTCEVPCGYEVSAPSAPPSETPTTRPTATCTDDETYTSPINNDLGCELYEFAACDCYAFQDYMTASELQDLFTRCPVTCNVPCGYQVPVQTNSPTLGMSPPPSSQPSACIDDENYESPFSNEFGCDFFAKSTFGCLGWGVALTQAQTEELLESCPVSCDVPCR